MLKIVHGFFTIFPTQYTTRGNKFLAWVISCVFFYLTKMNTDYFVHNSGEQRFVSFLFFPKSAEIGSISVWYSLFI